ncbi:hypothetical protein ACE6H2_026235 [Prunus campanulata]
MKEILKQQKVALESSITSLWAESKVAVETKEDAANLCHLVKFKPWKDWTELLVELDDLVNTGHELLDMYVGSYEVIVAAYKSSRKSLTPDKSIFGQSPSAKESGKMTCSPAFTLKLKNFPQVAEAPSCLLKATLSKAFSATPNRRWTPLILSADFQTHCNSNQMKPHETSTHNLQHTR